VEQTRQQIWQYRNVVEIKKCSRPMGLNSETYERLEIKINFSGKCA